MKLFVPLIVLISSLSFTSFAVLSDSDDERLLWDEEQFCVSDSEDEDYSSDDCSEEDYYHDKYCPETTRTKNRYWYQAGFGCKRTKQVSLHNLKKEFAASTKDKDSRRAAKIEKCFKSHLKAQRDMQQQKITNTKKPKMNGDMQIPEYLHEHAMMNPNPCQKRHPKHQRDSAAAFIHFN